MIISRAAQVLALDEQIAAAERVPGAEVVVEQLRRERAEVEATMTLRQRNYVKRIRARREAGN